MSKPSKLAPPVPGRAYDIGYGKPPVEHQFRKGVSGNPNGRPRGRKNRFPALNEERLKTIIVAEAYRTIRVTDNGRPVTISMAEAVIRGIALAAAKGHQRSQRLFTEMLTKTEQANKELHDQWLETAIDYKVEWQREFERCARIGLQPPNPLPHPDDIIIDMNTGQVRVVGPFTKEEKAAWDHLKQRKTDCIEAIAEYERELQENPTCEHADALRREIRYESELLAKIRTIIKD